MVIKNKVLEKKNRSIIIGDPLYFEEFKGRKLKSLVVDLSISKNFLQEVELICEDEMYLLKYYFAINESMMKMLKNNEKYKYQKAYIKEIGVDSACYLYQVNDQMDEIRTNGDGYWGNEVLIKDENKKLESGYIEMMLPYKEEKESLKIIDYFFY